MMKRLLPCLLGLLVSSGAYAQVYPNGYSTVPPNTVLANPNGWAETPAPVSFIISVGKPTISSGFGTSPSVPNGTSDAAFTVNVGTGGTASSGVIAFATAAPNGWACTAVDGTHSASFIQAVVPTSTTTVTITNYSRTTGLATAWTASDILTVSCSGY